MNTLYNMVYGDSINYNDNTQNIELNNVKNLDKLNVTVTLSLSENIIKNNPSKTFINWLSSNPKLSIQDICFIDKFYKEKADEIDITKCEKVRQRYMNKYNNYKNYFLDNNEKFILLDEYFFDETCVNFLLFIITKDKITRIQYSEVILDN